MKNQAISAPLGQIEENKARFPKSLTTVTRLSKTVALCMFVTLPFVGFLLGMKYQKLVGTDIIVEAPAYAPARRSTTTEKLENSQQEESPVDTGSGVVNEPLPCYSEECLYSENETLLGYANLIGYYKEYDGTQWEWGNAPVTCQAIVSTGGNEMLLEELKKTAKAGNTLNKFVGDDFYINIDLLYLSDDQVGLIKNSTADNPVKLGIVRTRPRGTGASTCFSVFTIVSVKKA